MAALRAIRTTNSYSMIVGSCKMGFTSFVAFIFNVEEHVTVNHLSSESQVRLLLQESLNEVFEREVSNLNRWGCKSKLCLAISPSKGKQSDARRTTVMFSPQIGSC